MIGYFSKMLNPAESRMGSRHREILALSLAIKHFDYHLIGNTFSCLVDHKSMLYMFREHYKSALSIKMVNCMVYLLQFDFKLIHTAGNSVEMASADYLSRLPSSTLTELDNQSKQTEIPDRIFQIAVLPTQAKLNIEQSNARHRR